MKAIPVGIDCERFDQAREDNDVKSKIAELKEMIGGRKVVLGVDRLDMIKGIPEKLLAFKKFFQDHKYWQEKVVLVQIAVPTRTEVPEYQRLTREVHKLVGEINGKFGTLKAVPIHHLDTSLNFNDLCALYAVTDIALVTSMRDGMNLVSFEFVVCQESDKGVLILSEFAGAAQSLEGAITVSPWDVAQVANAINKALNMPVEEIKQRHETNLAYIKTHTAQGWAEAFVRCLAGPVLDDGGTDPV